MGRRILFLAPQPFFRQRGMCLAQLNCLKTLAGLGLEVDVLTFPFGSDPRIPGIRLLRLPVFPGVRDIPIGLSWQKLVLDAAMFLRLLPLLALNRYGAVHACEEAGFLAALLKPLFGFRFVYDMDDILSRRLADRGHIRAGWARRGMEAVERWMIRSADLVLTNSNETQAYARSLTAPERVLFYEHVAPLDPAQAQAQTAASPGATILYAGNLEPYQGIDLLLESLPAVLRRAPRTRCVIVGGEPDQIAAYRSRARELGITDALEWLGPRTLEESFDLMRRAALVVSPMTEVKAVPMKLYTYLAAGTPIVATDLPNHNQLLDRETAVLVEPTSDGLAAGLLQVLEDPGRFQARAEKGRALGRSILARAPHLSALRAAYREG